MSGANPVVGVRITADASGLVGQVTGASSAVAGLKRELAETAGSATALGSASAGAGAGAKRLKDGIDTVERSTERSRRSMSGLGQQLQDVQVQLQSGTSLAQVFSQQAGQMAFALEGAGGKVGAFAQFLGGPWGFAIIGATSLALTFGEQLFGTGEAAKQAAKELEKNREAAKKLGEAQLDATRTVEQKLKLDLQVLQSLRDERAEIVRNTIEQVNYLKALQEVNRVRATRGGPQGDIAALGLADTDARIARLEASLPVLQKNLADAQRPIDLRSGRDAAARAEQRSDPAGAVRQRADDAVKAIIQRFAGDNPRIEAETAKVIAARDRELKAIEASTRGRTSANREFGRTVSSAEAAAIARNAGFQVNSAVRTYAQQAALYNDPRVNRPGNPVAKPGTSAHERGNALDIQFGPEVNPGSIRKAFADQGVALTKVFKELGHYHVEFASNAREVAAQSRAAAQEQKALERELEGTLRALDPATTAAGKYADQLEAIARLTKAGKITPDQASDLRVAAGVERFDEERKRFESDATAMFDRLGGDWAAVLAEPLADGGRVADAFEVLTRKIGDDLEREFGSAADALQRGLGNLGALVGGKAGQTIGGLSDFFGAVLTKRESIGADGKTRTLDVFGQNGDAFGRDLSKVLSQGIGINPEAASKIGAGVGKAFGGAQFGAALNDAFSPIAKGLGIKTSRTGAMVGGTIGSFLPFGREIGAVFGSIVGGLFKKTKTGSAVITSATGDVTGSGKLGAASAQDASTVQGGIRSLAEALGGQLGDFRVSIGRRGDYYRVSGSGATNLGDKKPGRIAGLLYDGKDEGEAIRVAILDAIADGGVTGISAAMQRALRSTKDLDQAVKEALKVREIEDVIGGLGTQLERQFREFEGQAKERLRVARDYGFDVIKIEAKNAEDRKKLLDEVLGARVGSLQALVKDLSFGDLFEGTAVDRRAALLAQIATAKSEADAGKDGAADTLATLTRQLVETSKEAFGTAGGEYASDRQSALSNAAAIIKAETDRATAAQKAAEEGNRLANETNDLLAVQNSLISDLPSALARVLGGGGGGSSLATLDVATLRTAAF